MEALKETQELIDLITEFDQLKKEFRGIDFEKDRASYDRVNNRIHQIVEGGLFHEAFKRLKAPEIDLSGQGYTPYTCIMKVLPEVIFLLEGQRLSDECDEDYCVEKLDRDEALEKLQESEEEITQKITELSGQLGAIKTAKEEFFK